LPPSGLIMTRERPLIALPCAWEPAGEPPVWRKPGGLTQRLAAPRLVEKHFPLARRQLAEKHDHVMGTKGLGDRLAEGIDPQPLARSWSPTIASNSAVARPARDETHAPVGRPRPGPARPLRRHPRYLRASPEGCAPCATKDSATSTACDSRQPPGRHQAAASASAAWPASVPSQSPGPHPQPARSRHV
jgi:hypothetical protein